MLVDYLAQAKLQQRFGMGCSVKLCREIVKTHDSTTGSTTPILVGGDGSAAQIHDEVPGAGKL
jgi:hypothetical protein